MHYERVRSDLQQAERTISMASVSYTHLEVILSIPHDKMTSHV